MSDPLVNVLVDDYETLADHLTDTALSVAQAEDTANLLMEIIEDYPEASIHADTVSDVDYLELTIRIPR